MTDSITPIATAAIDADALLRDRYAVEPEALEELQRSILHNGLRMPVEVYPLETPCGGVAYGLVSGFRRLAAFRALHTMTGQERWATIPALVREPASIAEAMVAMVEENEVRAEVSPYERGRIAMLACHRGFFASIEEAVDRLFAAATPAKRSRVRALARLAEEVDGCLTAPERLSQAQALRLAGACRAGFGEVIRATLEGSKMTDPAGQWQLLLPYIQEAEQLVREVEPAPSRPGRPKRVLQPRHGLTIRREMTRDGWILRFTGREARGELLELVMDEIERMFRPA